jgi:hypothetical protein
MALLLIEEIPETTIKQRSYIMRKLTTVNEVGKVFGGYHNFDEVYDHRCHLMVALMLAYPKLAWRADKNEDGSKWPGWFTAGSIYRQDKSLFIYLKGCGQCWMERVFRLMK